MGGGGGRISSFVDGKGKITVMIDEGGKMIIFHLYLTGN
jgi:hypothetical protein